MGRRREEMGEYSTVFGGCCDSPCRLLRHSLVGFWVRSASRGRDSIRVSISKPRMMNLKTHTLTLICMCVLISSTADGLIVKLTILETAVAKGAVCLDGSPPAYHFAPGFGSGVNNWLVHIEGGGWCHNITNCLYRSRGRLGSSKAMGSINFTGILNDHRQFNPHFYNWNKVKVGYCDGSSFTGDVERVDPVTNLHFRGARIFVAVLKDLLAKGMDNAENALLSGCSAGGLTSILQCDDFRAFLPASARVKCLSDGGFFINVKDIAGAERIKTYFNQIVTTHGSAKNLPSSCTSKLNPNMCFFPEYVIEQIQTPIFILNAAYDSWQIRNVLVPLGSDPTGIWKDCRLDITQCSMKQTQVMQDFRMQFLKALEGLGNSSSAGLFINSCFAHCQTELTEMWQFTNSPVLGNITIARAVGEWFYDQIAFKNIDCPYPCDSSCHNMKYDSRENPPARESPPEESSNGRKLLKCYLFLLPCILLLFTISL